MDAAGAEITVRALEAADRAWVRAYLTEHWGSAIQAVNGEILRPEEHEGFVAALGGRPVGLLTLRSDRDGSLEVTTLHASVEARGVGSALFTSAVGSARAHGAHRLWLVTTNDNLRALSFYQRRGMRLTALRPGAVDASRTVKPEIPLVAANGIPIRDELVLELRFDAPGDAHDAR